MNKIGDFFALRWLIIAGPVTIVLVARKITCGKKGQEEKISSAT